MKNILLFGLISILSLGCAPRSKYIQAQSSLKSFEEVSTLVLDMEFTEGKLYLVDAQPDPSVRMSAAHAGMAAAQSVQVPPGTTAGEAGAAVAIGVLVGTQLVKMGQDASDQKRANAKTGPVQEILPKEKLIEMLGANLRKAADSQDKVKFFHEEKPEAISRLLVAPELHFSSNLSRLELKLDATVVSAVSGETIYRNSFEYWSKPVGGGEEGENCSSWAADECSRFSSHIEEGAREVMAMFLFDMESSLRGEEQAGTSKTNRIVGEEETVFLRGNAVKVLPERVWVKDLRGNIRSLYGRLDSMEQALNN